AGERARGGPRPAIRAPPPPPPPPAGAPGAPGPGPLPLRGAARGVRPAGAGGVPDPSRRRPGDGRRDDGRPVRGNDDTGCARPLRAAAHGAEVARVGDAVEHREERPVDGGKLVRVGVAIRLDAGDGAPRVAGAGGLPGGAAPGWSRVPAISERSRSARTFGRASASHGSAAAARSVARSSSTSRRPRSASRTARLP